MAVVVLLTGAYFLFLRPYSPARALRTTSIPVDASWASAGDTLFYTQDSTLYSATFSAQTKWSAATIQPNMKVAASQNFAVVYLGKQLQCFDSNGNLRYAKEFYGEILAVRCGISNIAVHVKEESGTYRMLVLDASGTETSLDIDASLLVDFGYYGEGALYCYTIDNTSMSPSSQISLFSAELAATGKLLIADELLQHLIFYNDSVYVVGSNYLQQMDALGTVSQQLLIYGWNYVSSDIVNGQVAVVLAPGGTFADSSRITNVRLCVFGKADVYLQLKPGVQDVFLKNGKLFAVAEQELYVYTLNGSLEAEYALPFAVSSVKDLAGQNALLLTSEDGVSLLNLP